MNFYRLSAAKLADAIQTSFKNRSPLAFFIIGRFTFRNNSATVRAFRDPDDETHFWVYVETRIRRISFDLPAFRVPETSIRTCEPATAEQIRNSVFEAIQQAWMEELHKS